MITSHRGDHKNLHSSDYAYVIILSWQRDLDDSHPYDHSWVMSFFDSQWLSGFNDLICLSPKPVGWELTEAAYKNIDEMWDMMHNVLWKGYLDICSTHLQPPYCSISVLVYTYNCIEISDLHICYMYIRLCIINIIDMLYFWYVDMFIFPMIEIVLGLLNNL